MLEPQRSQYLRALGIEVYVPRWVLPGAKESQPCAWDFLPALIEAQPLGVESPSSAGLESVAAIVGLAPISIDKVEQRRSLPEEMRVDLTPSTAKTRALADTVIEVRDAITIVAAPKIALSVVVGAGGFLIVDDAPSSTAMRSDYLRLLTNILSALQVRSAQPALDIFIWPLAKRPQLDQSEVAARETLAAHLHNQIQRHAIHTLLLLGDAAQQWCAIDNGDLRCVKSVSALACLRTPATKRSLWNDVRHLAAAQ